jgi:hypothetical protein
MYKKQYSSKKETGKGLIFTLKVSVLNTLNYTVDCEQHKTGSFEKDSGSHLVG